MVGNNLKGNIEDKEVEESEVVLKRLPEPSLSAVDIDRQAGRLVFAGKVYFEFRTWKVREELRGR